MRLIDADALLERIENPYQYREVTAWVNDMPTIAQQEIIRCKDCKWFREIGCAVYIVDETDKPKADDFCSFAERKGEQP